MKTQLVWLGVVLFALPLGAQQAERRVVVPCLLTTSTVTISGAQNEAGSREFAVRVFNNSARTIAMPRTPVFGWRVEYREHGQWRFKAEGGPVRRVSPKDEEHIVALGNSDAGPMLEIAPAHSADFYTYLAGSEKALQPEHLLNHYRLTLYWAASAALVRSNRKVPPCALAPEWEVDMQKLPPPK